MRAVLVVGYRNLKLTRILKPRVSGPFDVTVRIGGAVVCAATCTSSRASGSQRPAAHCPIRSVTRTPVGRSDRRRCDERRGRGQGDRPPLIICGLCRASLLGDNVHCENSAIPGIDAHGGYVEFLRTSARSVVRIADALKPADVEALMDAGLNAYHAAARAARTLRPADRCVVIGAGGLGHIGIQVLKAFAASELIVVDRNPAPSNSRGPSEPTT